MFSYSRDCIRSITRDWDGNKNRRRSGCRNQIGILPTDVDTFCVALCNPCGRSRRDTGNIRIHGGHPAIADESISAHTLAVSNDSTS